MLTNLNFRKKTYTENEWQQHADIQAFDEIIFAINKSKPLFENGLDKLYLQEYEECQSCMLHLAGKTYVNFASFDYLNFAQDPEVKQAAKEAIDRYGTSASASRIVSGDRDITVKLEHAIAEMIGVDDAIVYTGGHATMVNVLTAFFSKPDLIIYDQLIHNSAVQGAMFSGAHSLQFFHNDWEDLELKLRHNRQKYRRVVIVFEGVYSMDGDLPPIEKLIELKKKYHCLLMVDEAHSVGVLGKRGGGIREYFNLNPTDIDFWMGTISKALGSCGGYIAGSQTLVSYLKYTSPGFVFSTGCSPANVAAALTAIRIMQREPKRLEKLHANAKFFLKLAKEAGFNTGDTKNTPIVPIILGDSITCVRTARALWECGINAAPILAPAVPNDKSRIRFLITHDHTEAQLENAMKQLVAITKNPAASNL